MKGLLANFIVFYSRVYSREFEDSSESDSIYSKYIMKLLEYIENNYSKEIDTEDISNAIGLSPDYVAKQFKLVLGISPIEYLRNYRIAKAMELLKNTNSSIDEISHKLGFASVSLFSRQFKSILKVTPTEFRKG
jgi:AraC-like DNA-binding protein